MDGSSKALQRYLELEAVLRNFFDEMAPDFCKNIAQNHNCYPRLCCSRTGIGYHYGDAYKELNKARIEKYGKGDLDRTCVYLTDEGCRLATHKPPLCIAHACDPLVNALKEKGIDYDRLKVESLLEEVLNDVTYAKLREGKFIGFGMSDEEFLGIRKNLEECLYTK